MTDFTYFHYFIAKSKYFGSLPHNVFVKLYDSSVWPAIAYGASIWGHKAYSCINAVQNRAMRYFLGVGKYTPIAALYGELAWQPPQIKQWESVGRQWHRFQKMEHSRINYKIFAHFLSKSSWQCEFNKYMIKLGLSEYVRSCGNLSSKNVCDEIVNKSMTVYIEEWRSQ